MLFINLLTYHTRIVMRINTCTSFAVLSRLFFYSSLWEKIESKTKTSFDLEHPRFEKNRKSAKIRIPQQVL